MEPDALLLHLLLTGTAALEAQGSKAPFVVSFILESPNLGQISERRHWGETVGKVANASGLIGPKSLQPADLKALKTFSDSYRALEL